MKKWFSISIGLFLLIFSFTLTGSGRAAFDAAEVMEAKVGDVLDESSTVEGSGFYLSIYEDTVKNATVQTTDEIKKRFGIDFDVDLSLSEQSGQYIFTDFFENPWGYHTSTAAPKLKDTLRSDCVRIRAAEADEEARRWQLVKRRLQRDPNIRMHPNDPNGPNGPNDPNDANGAKEGSDSLLEREELLRLIGIFDETAQAKLQVAIDAIPSYESLDDQQTLLNCYQDLSTAVDFELRLQSILESSRKQLELSQTFVNGVLDDLNLAGIPRYDLLFDLEVIDYILFGSPVAVERGVGGVGEFADGSSQFGVGSEGSGGGGSPMILDFEELLDSGGEGGGSGGVKTTDDVLAEEAPALAEESTTPGFGSSSLDFAGPYCPVDPEVGQGVVLDFSGLGPPGSLDRSPVPPEGVTPGALRPFGEVSDAEILGTEDQDQGIPTTFTAVGDTDGGLNVSQLCEGSLGVDFGNDMLRFIFCLSISFEKIGKTWQTVRDENCIACHIYEMNRIFEEQILNSSVRPHKNTGQIMESAICEDGYGDDIGFHFFLEWVPVRFYPEICYPKGGVMGTDFAEQVGYPEIVARVNKEGFEVDCELDFKDADAVERCQEALKGFDGRLDYDSFVLSYRLGIEKAYAENIEDRPQDLDYLDPAENVWRRLMGYQGLAERELHVFLYRLGKVAPQFGEEEYLRQDFKERLDYLKRTMEDIQADDTLKVDEVTDQKAEQLLCLKGYRTKTGEISGTVSQLKCGDYMDTVLAVEQDINDERDRVMRLTGEWNQRSADFNSTNQCGVFEGSKYIDDALFSFFEDRFSSGYYIETPERKVQTPEEQVTQQITSNVDFDDIGFLLNEINQQVEHLGEVDQQQLEELSFKANQEQALHLYSALAQEFLAFRTNMLQMTEWWAEMFALQFVSKGGQKINVLQSFEEKLR
ncbi:MAG: hypothetical protein U1C97_00795 [Candidatus Gracilibacteria bacterium]|nr:hypothetical protein [bacterium]MDZ4216838.1 hypothetical protein [Candidatus Gracilibacteria bacterium]